MAELDLFPQIARKIPLESVKAAEEKYKSNKGCQYLDDAPDDGRYFCQEYDADAYIGAIYTIAPTVAATWPVPEPATAELSLLALAALAARRRC